MDSPSTSTPRWPPTPTAWGLSLLGAALFIVGTLMLWRGLMVMLGVRAVSPGGGEFFMALFVGAPTMLLAIGLLTVASAREGWKSLMSLAFLWLSIGFSATWLAAMMVRR